MVDAVNSANATGKSAVVKVTDTDGGKSNAMAVAVVGADGNAAFPASLGGGGGIKVDPAPSDYETVAASQTDQMMGATGAIGDRLDAVLIIPVTTSPGAVSIEDGATNTEIFAGGASSVSNLVPFLVPLGTQGILSTAGGWELTTGANVRAIAFGQFT